MSELGLKSGSKSSKFLPVEIEGITKTLGEWAEHCAISYDVIKIRFIRGKRGIDLISDVRQQGHKIPYKG